jgi:hypothetical protein
MSRRRQLTRPRYLELRDRCAVRVEPSRQRPAIGELHRAAIATGIGERIVGGVAADLPDAGEARELLNRMLGAPVRRMEIGDSGRVGPSPGAIIAGARPEIAGRGLGKPGSIFRICGSSHGSGTFSSAPAASANRPAK